METNWKHKLSSLALASTVTFQDTTVVDDDKKGEELFKGKTLDDIKESLIDIKYHPMITNRAPDASYKCEHFTGRDLIGYLIKSNHLGDVKSFYLNFETNEVYKPYSLVTVPKSFVSFTSI